MLMQGETHGYYYYNNQIWNILSAQGLKIIVLYDWYACNSNFTLIRLKKSENQSYYI